MKRTLLVLLVAASLPLFAADNSKAETQKDLPARSHGKVSDAQIVFVARVSGAQEVFIMDLDGSNRTQLTHDGLNKFLPHFSPDGTQLVYTKFLVGGYGTRKAQPDVVVYDFASAKETQLTHTGKGFQPVWSPDGKRIAYNTKGSSLRIMKADGSNDHLVGAPSGAPDDKVWGDIAWSSDDWILFTVAQFTSDGFKVRLDKIRPDGTARTKVTDGGPNYTPSGMEQSGDADAGFSADGKTIYSSRGFPKAPPGLTGRTERKLYSFSSEAWVAGKVETDLSFPAAPDCIEGVPKGSPDGTRVLLFRACAGEPHNGVFLTDKAGSYRTWITDGFGPDWNPVAKLTSLPIQQPVPRPSGINSVAETKYLTFQLMTVPGTTSPMAFAANPPSVPSKAQMEAFVREIVKAIGTTGDARHKLCFAPTHIRFDEFNAEVRRLIHDAFAVARENDVAVVFHLDDSMYWAGRKDLLSNPDNRETADWNQSPNTGRRIDWSHTPSKFAPQMCYNSPAIQAAVKERGGLIGAEVKRELDALKAVGKEHLFAGVIAGSETMIGRDFDTDQPLGYRALGHRGFSASHPPKDAKLERVAIVKEFMELWANALATGGVPREKLFCHIAFTAQGLDHKEQAHTTSHFSPPEVAFSSAYRPGFSTYPEGSTFTEIHAAVAQHGAPGWISAEGANVSPTGLPGARTMETYLGLMFNHGAVLVNIFSWGIGGEAHRNNFFRQVTESPEALAAYGKFLRHEPLVETAVSTTFQDKMHRIQQELPGWVQKTGRQAQVMPLAHQLSALIKERKYVEADKVADEILALMSSTAQTNASASDMAPAQGGEARKHQSETGEPAIITRDYIQDELKLADDQKQKLQKTSPGFRQLLDGRDNENIWAFIKETLHAEQFKRFEQLELQHEGASALFRPEIAKELKITDEQRSQFMGLVQQMTKEVVPLIKESKSVHNPAQLEEFRLKVIKLRMACLEKCEALMSAAQKKRWQDMLGTPFDTLRHH